MFSASLAPLVRLCLSPLLIGGASSIAQRRGPKAAGWFAALPLTSGPVVLVLALERGSVFASRASIGILLAVVALALYVIIYCYVSRRRGWLHSGLFACAAYLGLLFPLGRLRVSLGVAFLLACSAVLGTRPLLPHESSAPPRSPLPVWDIPSRMAVAAALVWVLARLSWAVGPLVSGLLAPFPVAITIMSTSIHRRDGAAVARQFLSSLLTGLSSFAVFFFATGALLPTHGIAFSFAVATVGALATHAVAIAAPRAVEPRLPISPSLEEE